MKKVGKILNINKILWKVIKDLIMILRIYLFKIKH